MSTYQSKYTGAEIDLRLEEAEKISPHMADTENPHGTTKSQVGLGNADNTSDALKPLSTAATVALAGKVDKVAGKGLSANDYTNQDRDKLAGIDVGAEVNPVIADDLITADPAKVLSANQGKILKDNADALADLVSTNVGDLETLTTTDKSSLVNATNEVKNLVDTKFAILKPMIEDFTPLGVSWDKGQSPTLTRTDGAVGMTANIGIDDQVVTNDFDSASIYRDIYKVTDTLGNDFIRIPKFYIRKTDTDNLKTWRICKNKLDGYYLPWCFWDFTNSRELPYIDVGCYNASLDGTKLASKTGTYPLANTNIVNFRTYAQNNNADGLFGYQQLDAHVIDVLRTLFFVEFGTLNSQAIMQGFTAGQYRATHVATATEPATNRIILDNAFADLYRVGQAISVGTSLGDNQIFYGRTITAIDVVDASNKAINFDGEPVNIAEGNTLYNTGWKSGFSAGVTAKSGCIVANDGKHPCFYRGIENPFGSVWQFVDGINITNNQAWVAKNPSDYASNVFASPYEKLSYENLNANGYGPVSMGFDANLSFAEFATNATGGTTSKHYCDRYYQSAGGCIALFGGRWPGGLGAGLSCWALDDSSSTAIVTFGGRLLKKPL